MKKWILISFLVFLFIFVSCKKQKNEEASSLEKAQEKEEVAPVAKGLESVLDSAIINLKEGNISEGAGLLLDGILLVKPSGDWPEGFENTVLFAKEQYQSGNLTKGGELISEALSLIQPPVEPDEGVKEALQDAEQAQKERDVTPIAEIFHNKILSAKEEFKKGNADSGVVLIFEGLLLLSPR